MSGLTNAGSPSAKARQAARREQWAAEQTATQDPMYQRALKHAGCTVLATESGWVAVSPAGAALFGKLYGGAR